MAKRRANTQIAIAAAGAIVQAAGGALERKALVDDLLERGLVASRASGYRAVRAAIDSGGLRAGGDLICLTASRRARTRRAIDAAVQIVQESPAMARDGIAPAALRKSLVLDLLERGLVGSRSAAYRVMQAAVADYRLRVDSDLFALMRLP